MTYEHNVLFDTKTFLGVEGGVEFISAIIIEDVYDGDRSIEADVTVGGRGRMTSLEFSLWDSDDVEEVRVKAVKAQEVLDGFFEALRQEMLRMDADDDA